MRYALRKRRRALRAKNAAAQSRIRGGHAVMAILICALFGGSSANIFLPADAHARGNAWASAERACREATADRLRVHRADVSIGAIEDISVRGERLEVHWRSAQGATGICVCVGARVLSWEQRGGPRSTSPSTSPDPSADSVCAEAVASRIRKRPSDIDIDNVEVRHRNESLVYWMSYQGERGTCLVENGQVKRLEFD